ncbi:MAG: YlcI/YnfO family protein [Phormidesmis sp.]
MKRLTLRLPENLHEQLSRLAESEGVSLNQYIVYLLTRQVASFYTVQILSESSIDHQKANLKQWLQASELCSETEAAEILAEREPAPLQAQLSSDTLIRFQSMLQQSQ